MSTNQGKGSAADGLHTMPAPTRGAAPGTRCSTGAAAPQAGTAASAATQTARPVAGSPWRRGPMCHTPSAQLSFVRYVARGRRQATPKSQAVNIIDRTADGRPLSISASVRMVGNSVSPPPLLAIARANLDPVRLPERLAA